MQLHEEGHNQIKDSKTQSLWLLKNSECHKGFKRVRMLHKHEDDEILKAVLFWTLLPKSKRKYYSFLKATQSNKAILTVPFDLWFDHLASEVSKNGKSFHSFPLHYTSKLFSWLNKKLEIKTLLILKSTPVKQWFSLPLFCRGNHKKASHEVLLKKKINSGENYMVNMKFLKIGNQKKEEENCFLVEARKASMLQLFLFIMVQHYSKCIF